MNLSTPNLLGNQCTITLDGDGERSAGFATQAVANLLSRLAMTLHTIHFHKAVTRHQSTLCGRHMLVWVADIDIAVTLHDDSTYTAILTCGHHTKVIILALRYIDRIWIYLTEHGVDAGLDEFIVVEGIYIIDIQLTHHIGVDGQVLVDACGL